MKGKDKMIKLTKNEETVLNAVIKVSEAGTLDCYVKCTENEEDNALLATLDCLNARTKKNENELGGTLASLEKKGLVVFCEAEEYGLGCNCWYVTEDGIKHLLETS